MKARMFASVLVLSAASTAVAAEAPQFANVGEVQAAHDRALVRDLAAYLRTHPKAEDADQGYMTLFSTVIEHDWFGESEAFALRYLADHPEGPVRSLAQIVATMARADAGQFPEALLRFKELMRGLGKAEQEEFAANFTDSLANSATAAGAYDVARQAYELLLERYGDSPTLARKVKDDLNRLSKVGKPAPSVVVRDLKDDPFRLESLRGKYVLVDFWATWCAPCVAELPRLQAAYAKYRAQGFEIVAVSLDETKTAVTDFVRSRGIPWRQIHNASSGGDMVEAFGVNAIPATFLIDPRGVVVRLELRGPNLEKTLASLLKTPAVGKTASAKTAR